MDENGEETNKDELHFFYDSNSKPAFVEYNGEMYRYIHNLQGDIIGIVDSSGNLVVEYKYDAWGKPISTTGSMASTLGAVNPFLYRGYVYDTETGFYYLRSRYYSPGFARFINTDSICISGLLCNTFLYCLNQPTNMADSTGNESYSVVLNIYDKYEWNGLNGHYDISIISNENPDTGWVFSYGGISAKDPTGRYNLYFSTTRTDVDLPIKRLVLLDSLSEEDLDTMRNWFYSYTKELKDKRKENRKTYKIKTGLFTTYDIPNAIYCGSGAAELTFNIPNIFNPDKNPYSAKALSVMNTLYNSSLVVDESVISTFACGLPEYGKSN